jgi:hypothetical protein
MTSGARPLRRSGEQVTAQSRRVSGGLNETESLGAAAGISFLKQTQDHNMTDKPSIHVNVYGTTPPRAAEFGKGARDLAEIEQATDARRVQRPGDAEK